MIIHFEINYTPKSAKDFFYSLIVDYNRNTTLLKNYYINTTSKYYKTSDNCV